MQPTQEDGISPPVQRLSSSGTSPDSIVENNSSWCGSLSLTEYKVCNGGQAADASTQTEESARRTEAQETFTRGVSTDDGSLELGTYENHQNQVPQMKENSEFFRNEISPPPSSSSTSSGGKTETLESLIRAEASKINSFRILKEEDIRIPSNLRFKPANMLMQLISCGSISVKDHSFGLIPTYKPRFSYSKSPSPLICSSMTLGELDCLSEKPKLMDLRLEDKEYFSGSLIETKAPKGGDGFTTLKRSSAYNADR